MDSTGGAGGGLLGTGGVFGTGGSIVVPDAATVDVRVADAPPALGGSNGTGGATATGGMMGSGGNTSTGGIGTGGAATGGVATGGAATGGIATSGGVATSGEQATFRAIAQIINIHSALVTITTYEQSQNVTRNIRIELPPAFVQAREGFDAPAINGAD